jgi:hypothetical protein
MDSNRIGVILTTNDQIVAVPKDGDCSFAVFLYRVFNPNFAYNFPISSKALPDGLLPSLKREGSMVA